jgi:hypothetical protein
MPKETITKSSEGELLRLKYTFRYGDKFDEPNDDWLKCIEVTSDELLGSYSKAEDNALSTAFGGWGKKRINIVFDAIGFVYPDYHYPVQGQGKKRKAAALAASAEPAPKAAGKKMKVLTHRPYYIESVVVPEFGGKASSAAESRQYAPVQKAEESATMPKAPSVEPVETKVDKDKADKSTTEEVKKMPGILSPLTEATTLKAQKSSVITPRRRRMVNVLDVLETTDSIGPASTGKVAEAIRTQSKADTKQIEVETTLTQAEAEAESTVPTKTKLAATEQKAEEITPDIAFEKSAAKEAEYLAPEAFSKDLDYIIRHASEKRLSEEENFEAKHYARELKYPKGALVFNGMDEDDFLYCLPDNKELSVCREMSRSMGFPKLEAGLCAMTKDDLADSLAYNSLKVLKL